MASTITTVRDNAKARVSSGSSEAEPTNPEIEEWVRNAFRIVIGICPPIQETAVPLDDDWTAAVTADEVYAVSSRFKTLVRGQEWEKDGNSIKVNPAAAEAGDRVSIWYFKRPTITTAVTTIDTSCMFGDDWLEPVATVLVTQAIELHNAHGAGSADASGHASMYRVLEDTASKLLEPYTRRRAEWINAMQQSLQSRIQLGDGVPRQSPYRGFRNNSKKINRLTGVDR